MDRQRLQAEVDSVRLAITQGQQSELANQLNDLCLLDAVQVIIEACKDSIAGMPDRIANFMYARDDAEIGNQEYIEHQRTRATAMQFIRKLAQTDCEENGCCATVAWTIHRLMEESPSERDAIAGIAFICSNSVHARQLFEKHIAYAIESDTISTLA